MQVTETKLKGCYIIEPTIFGDERGYFFETFNKEKFKELTGKEIEFVQDNEAFSNRGILRGLHLQKGEFAQAKLVRVVKGKVLDVVVDVRPNSKTYGEFFSCVLSEQNKKQLFVPRGFAHGYSVLEDNTVFVYKCDNFYQPKSEGGIIFNDETLNIDWMLSENEIAISEKDKVLQAFNELEI
ncbi:dTDP-4-dehydrorhamnose 3,5-epimerase [Polaribacter huanghezhanensis]|uniref:dTDP-4-dehydrorhamnose 3,5-epimerase n=1 Tax=Polaribacter huanghezhanensis TaxID=1354726 RepID=UPI0026477240|nr:dTDP-4-dehydrorhamnose 3,5-epimerase [Polaribacter huanghezhanensis]WKD85547.1 dTDP-4-dehydrorhamnose 3,5-epimerase [Polaribacter huanghezhanensis]